MSEPFRSRLAALRAALKQACTDGFILQRTDQHGSEYLPECEQRVAWLTGFTGSAAMVVITAEKAAVFSDGRYTVQLTEEVDETLFERCHLITCPPSKWLEQNFKDGLTLGYDPMLTGKAGLGVLKKSGDRCGFKIKPIANPVDAIWHDRPEPPRTPVTVLGDEYSGKFSAIKRAEIGKKLQKAGACSMLVTAADHIAWLLNIRGGDIPFNPLCLSHLILDKDGGCRWFVDARKLENTPPLDNAVQIEPFEALLPAFADYNGQKILVDPASVHVGFSDALKQAGALIVEASDPIALAKAKKNDVELTGAVSAQRRDGAAMVRFLRWLDGIESDGSVSELDAADRLFNERRKDPLFQGLSFDTISAHGPNAALPHYRVNEKSNRPLTPGTVYLVDSGGQYFDGTTDITRTIALGDVPDEIRHRNTLVLKGHIQLARTRFPKGASGAQLDTLARHPLWQAGLDFDHGTGHGIGAFLCVHEGPQRIAKTGSVPLETGMIISNEPGYYKTGHYGIRIENLVIVERAQRIDEGEREFYQFATITLCPFDRNLIDADMLDDGEKDWINTYHANVRKELSDLLDGDERAWLEAKTLSL